MINLWNFKRGYALNDDGSVAALRIDAVQIHNLEPQVTSLSRLEHLSASSCTDTDWDFLQQLTQLNSLDLRNNNQIKDFGFLAHLEKLHWFPVYGLEPESPPIEILNQGLESTRAWFEANRERLN